MTTIICNDTSGNPQTYQVGWDNSAEFFNGVGYIPRLWCEGGYAGQGYTYVSDELTSSTLGWYSGVIIPVLSSETQTVVVDSSVVVPNND